eukprot:sb/3476757/
MPHKLGSGTYAANVICFSRVLVRGETGLTAEQGQTALNERLVERHGEEAEKHTLHALFSQVEFSTDGKSTGKDFHQIVFALALSQSPDTEVQKQGKFLFKVKVDRIRIGQVCCR